MKTAGTPKKSTSAVKSTANGSLTKTRKETGAAKALEVQNSDSSSSKSTSIARPDTLIEKVVPASSQTKTSTTPISSEQVSERAYQLWIKRGCVHGFHVEDWLEAELQLVNEGIA